MSTNSNIGQILDKSTLVVNLHIGKAGEKNNPDQFDFGLAGMMNPMITSKKTGKRFMLPLSDLITIALQAGIEEEN